MGIEEAILQAVREEGVEEGKKVGKEEGIEQAKLQIALRMKKAGIPIAAIAKVTELSNAQIAKLG